VVVATRYVSQNWLKSDREQCIADGYAGDFIAHWSDRSCGLACVAMAIHHRTGRAASLPDLHRQVMGIGGYCDAGWIHAKLAELLVLHGVPAIATPLADHESKALLEQGKLIIASVRHQLPRDAGRGGHLILLRSVASTGGQDYIFFNDPSRWGEFRRCIRADRAFSSYSGRAIVIG
jgi:hypothetical protein